MEEIDFSYDNRKTSEFILATILPYLEDQEYDNTEDMVEDIALRNYDKIRMIELLELLTPKERLVIIEFYGLFGKKAITMPELASRYHISKQAVFHTHFRALLKLKYYIELPELETKQMLEEGKNCQR